MNKYIKSAICVIAAAAVITPTTIYASNKKSQVELKAPDLSTSVTTTVATTEKVKETTTTATTTTTSATAKAEETTKKSTPAVTAPGQVKKSTTKAVKTTKAAKKVVFNYKPSELLKGKQSVRRWNVSDGKTSVKAEQIELKLTENGAPNGKAITRYAYVALVKSTPDGLKSLAAKQVTGNTVDVVATMASKSNALFAVNGEMCNHDKKSFRGFFNAADDSVDATVIKNGAIAQSAKTSPSLTMDNKGNWQYPVYVSPNNAQELINSGVITSVSYTYPLIWNGEPFKWDGCYSPLLHETDTRADNPSKHWYNDKTLVGQIDANTYAFAVSEGFGTKFLIDILQEMGAKNIYWGNGGHCATMYIKGYGSVNREGDSNPCLAADIMYF